MTFEDYEKLAQNLKEVRKNIIDQIKETLVKRGEPYHFSSEWLFSRLYEEMVELCMLNYYPDGSLHFIVRRDKAWSNVYDRPESDWKTDDLLKILHRINNL